MGGRGTFAKGNSVPFTYKTVGMIEDAKVLQGLGGMHSLPEESHTSSKYIKLKPDGTFHEMRIYDKNHYLVKEIAYHGEVGLMGNRHQMVLHVHDYQRDDFAHRSTRPITKDEYAKYKKYLIGVPRHDKW